MIRTLRDKVSFNFIPMTVEQAVAKGLARVVTDGSWPAPIRFRIVDAKGDPRSDRFAALNSRTFMALSRRQEERERA